MIIELTKNEENEIRYIRAMVEQYGSKSVTEGEFYKLMWCIGNLNWDYYIKIVEPVLRK
jgi:hypothetical protein